MNGDMSKVDLRDDEQPPVGPFTTKNDYASMVLDGEWDRLVEYTDRLRRMLGLTARPMTLVQHDQSSYETEVMAFCETRYGHHGFEITFMSDWRNADAETLRELIVHELLHVWLTPLRHPLTELHTAGVLSRRVHAVSDAGFDGHLEFAAHSLASVIADLLPLPEASGVPTEQEAA